MVDDINRWKKDFDRQVNLAIKISEDILEDVVEVFTARVTKKTPVGKPELWQTPAPSNYTPGNLKKSWIIDWKRKGGKIVGADVYNTQPYALRVENGWSTQTPPKGMMRSTFLELDQIIARAARKNRRG